jgi:3,4-dihydroxy 2-butanone 4-phosphate synthase/GTP cyclohydrolase II
MSFNSIPEIVEDIKSGKIVIMLDSERENEGDMILAAEFATPEKVAFMMKYGCGIICMPIIRDIASKFRLETLPRRNTDNLSGCFNTVSLDAIGCGGISAADRSKAIMTLVDDNAGPNSIRTPGHLFPLIANEGGVLARPGHTEAAIDLVKLARLKNAAILVEVMNDEKDNVANNDELMSFATKRNIKISTIKKLIDYRRASL